MGVRLGLGFWVSRERTSCAGNWANTSPSHAGEGQHFVLGPTVGLVNSMFSGV